MKAKKSSNRQVGRSESTGLKLQQLDKKDSGHNSATTRSSFRASLVYVCSGCNKPIKREKFLLKACDKYWHENCLRCDRCHSRLGELGSTLYNKSNMNLCRQDYLEMFGETGICSVCEKHICASEMVMRAKQNVYHLECFACQLCNQRFCVGDRFYLCENKIVCQYDYEEHILPIQRSLIEQSSDEPSSLPETGLVYIPGHGLESMSPRVGAAFATQNDDNLEGGIGFNQDKPSVSIEGTIEDADEDKLDETFGETLSNRDDLGVKKDTSKDDDEPVLEFIA